MEPIILVHGGAGDIPDSRVAAKISGVIAAAKNGYEILKKGGSSLDAVEEAVRTLEDDPTMNAGYGSVLNLDGEVEMDASVMIGLDLSAGAVTVVKDIAHPVSLARMVMEKTPHVLLAGSGANKFAKEQGVPTVPQRCLVTEAAKQALDMFKKLKQGQSDTEAVAQTEIGDIKNPGDVGTVGAVAMDSRGRLAAATSTGGINGKMVGRCSAIVMIGGGIYADDNIGAVSLTGHGESIAKYCLAHSIIKAMEHGLDVKTATKTTLEKMTSRLENTAGAITLSKTGQVGIAFTTERMGWAYQVGNTIHYGIEKEEDRSKPVVAKD